MNIRPSTSLGLARPFSARRDDRDGRRYFSDVRPKPSSGRPRPDVSVVFQHLGLPSPTVADFPQQHSLVTSAGGRVAFSEYDHPHRH